MAYSRIVRQTEAILNTPLNVCKSAGGSNETSPEFYKCDYFRESEGTLIELEKPVKVKVRIKYDWSIREVTVDSVAVSLQDPTITLISNGKPFSSTYSGTKGLTQNLQKTVNGYMKKAKFPPRPTGGCHHSERATLGIF